jgi:hypothetical protein
MPIEWRLQRAGRGGGRRRTQELAQRPPQRSLTKNEPLLVSMWLTKLFRGGPFFWHRIPYAAAEMMRCDVMSIGLKLDGENISVGEKCVFD